MLAPAGHSECTQADVGCGLYAQGNRNLVALGDPINQQSRSPLSLPRHMQAEESREAFGG